MKNALFRIDNIIKTVHIGAVSLMRPSVHKVIDTAILYPAVKEQKSFYKSKKRGR